MGGNTQDGRKSHTEEETPQLWRGAQQGNPEAGEWSSQLGKLSPTREKGPCHWRADGGSGSTSAGRHRGSGLGLPCWESKGCSRQWRECKAMGQPNTDRHVAEKSLRYWMKSHNSTKNSGEIVILTIIILTPFCGTRSLISVSGLSLARGFRWGSWACSAALCQWPVTATIGAHSGRQVCG